ncbi:MAG: fused MFS/spermidine synthase, partial [Gemmatimonadaceae bacterium]
MIAILVAAFVLSGAAGLMYESIWSRYLGLFVGHSAYAQIIVLVIFLGGMALGAHLAGRYSSRISSPLLWYAAVELVVGLLAMYFHFIFVATTAAAYDTIFPSLSGAALLAAKWAVAGALIFPQSVLLGATFPLMSAGVIRVAKAEESPGRILGLLYFANSLGAAAGVLFAGFVLIERVGMPGTLLVAGGVNVVVAIAVGLLARAHARLAAEREAQATETGARLSEPADRRGEASAPSALWRPLLLVSFGTAVASFIYEIAWIRMLSLVLGSATHSFELMLSAFILGLALGALWIRSRADRIPDPLRFLGKVQWAMGLLAVATLPLYLASFGWIGGVIGTVQPNDSGYDVFIVARYLIALVIMLPSTFCAGMTLPLITRTLMRAGAGERAIGAVYAVNTLGSIVGVILAGLVLMPVLGLKRLLVFGAVIDIAIGVWLLRRARRTESPSPGTGRWRRGGGIAFALPGVATAVFLTAIALLAQFDLARITSGVYRHGIVAQTSDYTFPFYKDGRTATVSMRRGLDGYTTLATNGKPDASLEQAWMDSAGSPDGELVQLTRDIATQLLLPIITLAHAPDAEHMAVIGHGSGVSSHVLLGSPRAREVVTIEIEPEMINASKHFRPANERVFSDPRSLLVIDDAKSYFASSGRAFDLILSEPSNPWVSGVSGLFTVEFYERVKRQLAEGGVFGQWLHLYELNDGLVTSVLAAIDSAFPAYEVFYTSNADILVIASADSVRTPRWSVTRDSGIASDLRRVVPMSAEMFESLRLGGRHVLRPMLLTDGAGNSDYFPVLDLGAERMRFMRENAEGYIGLTEGRFDVVAALSGRRAGFGTHTVPVTPEVARTYALARGTRLRAARELPPEVVAQMPRDADLRNALYRADQLDRLTATPEPPGDWLAWTQAVVQVDKDLHEGTAGVVDSAFFRRMHAFANRGGAPAEAR